MIRPGLEPISESRTIRFLPDPSPEVTVQESTEDDAVQQINDLLFESGPQKIKPHSGEVVVSNNEETVRPETRRVLMYKEGEYDYIPLKTKKT